jgi:hypothetical protein
MEPKSRGRTGPWGAHPGPVASSIARVSRDLSRCDEAIECTPRARSRSERRRDVSVERTAASANARRHTMLNGDQTYVAPHACASISGVTSGVQVKTMAQGGPLAPRLSSGYRAIWWPSRHLAPRCSRFGRLLPAWSSWRSRTRAAGGRVWALRSSVDRRIAMIGGAIPATDRRLIHPAWEFISLRTQPAPLRCALALSVGSIASGQVVIRV